MNRNKVITVEEAINQIQDDWTIGVEGFVGAGTPDDLCVALGKRFLEQKNPQNLTLIHSSGPGDAATRGANRIAHAGMYKRVISGHYGLVPEIGKLALANDFEAYNLPQGILTNFYRAVAGNRPGVLTKVGLGTFADPRVSGGKINEKAVEDIVEIVELGGEEWLFMKSFPVDCVLIRGTTADTRGNITMEREILTVDSLAMAMAARNSGGTVIVQVERIANPDSICSRDVIIPGIMVDHVVVGAPEHHMQTFGTQYKPELSGELRVPLGHIETLALDERKVLGRRASFELRPYDVINLGIGYPEAVSTIANEEKILDYLTMTVEPGIIGGMPLGGLDFGAAVNGEAVISMPDQFDFYDGGGLDLTCLGFAQCDSSGNVNASKFGPRIAGCGGFINISQNTRRVLFLGTFTTAGLNIAIEDGKVHILQEGKIRKFVEASDQITFCAQFSDSETQEVLYITDRCVFRLIEGELELIEVAPGIDIEHDILANMDFTPVIRNVTEMDPRIFSEQPMGIREQFMLKELRTRVTYRSDSNTLNVDFSSLELETLEDVDNIKRVVEEVCKGVGRKVNAIVNYNGFRLDDNIFDAYMEMGQFIISTYYHRVARHNTNEKTRSKFDNEYRRRQLAANIFASREEALDYLTQA
ncbi:MAG: acyl CoA:acetate/3-ketoacid CoA transferase [Desulfocapsaceae bacterium]